MQLLSLHLGQLYIKKGERELAIQAFESCCGNRQTQLTPAQIEQLIG